MSITTITPNTHTDSPSNRHIVYSDENLILMETQGQESTDLFNYLPEGYLLFAGCTSGELRISFFDKQIVAHANDIVMIHDRALILSVETTADFKGFGISIQSQLLQRIIHHAKDTQSIFFELYRNPVTPIDEEGMALFVEYHKILLMKLRNQSGSYLKEIVVHILCACLYELFSRITTPSADDSSAPLAQRDRLFLRFVNMLTQEDVPPRRQDYYATRLCVTTKYLSLVCKQVSGKTATEWINDYSRERIRYHLEYTSLTIKEISNLFEFPSLSFFGKYVKRLLGVSPSQYRQHFISSGRHNWP